MWWQGAASAAGLVPGRRHFDPVEFGAGLPYYFLVDVESEIEFQFRLAGGIFVEIWDSNFAGKSVGEETFGENWPSAVALYKSVCASRRPTLSLERLVVAGHGELTYRVLLLPLAADGKTVDMVLGSFDCDANTYRLISNFVPFTREQWQIVSVRHLDAG